MWTRFWLTLSAKQKKGLIIIGIALFSGILALTGYGFSKRGQLLTQLIDKAQIVMSERYDVDFQIGSYGFSGLRTVTMNDIYVIPKDRDSLAEIEHLAVSVQIWPLLFGEVKIGNLDLQNTSLRLVEKDSTNNYDFFLKTNKKDSLVQIEKAEKNYAALADRLIKQVFFKIPKNMKLSGFQVSYRDDSTYQMVRVPDAKIVNGKFETSFFLNDHDAEWLVKGFVDGTRQQLGIQLSSAQQNVELPFLQRKFGLGIRFNQISFDLQQVRRRDEKLLALKGAWSVDDLQVNHWRLADKDILLQHASGQGIVNIGSNFIELGKGSKIKVKEFELSPYVRYTFFPSKKFDLAVHTARFPAQYFFDAIPEGLFETLEGVKVDGEIKYDLDFKVELDKPDSLYFASSIDDADLKVTKWGNADILALNRPFNHKVYEDTTLVREIRVDPASPTFTSYNNISNELKMTLLNTEDPYFFEHKGFEEEAFQLSIVTNLKEKRFKRGASTISMQLVKNLYLSRDKTMFRKFEEILLVWLMEHSNVVSKERMFEIYLNIIEWGKNVYGVQEAAQYYFGKRPIELNLGESLFLSSIVPRPKTGLSSFDHTGHLKGWVQRHFSTYGYIMQRRGQLRDVQVLDSYGFYDVVLQPRLRPAKPKEVIDNQEDTIQRALKEEMEYEEKQRHILLERLFPKQIKERQEEGYHEED